MDIFLDTESDSLVESATKVHCLVLRDINTNEVIASCSDDPRWTGHTIDQGLQILDKASKVYAHNLLNHDRPLLKKLRGYEIPWDKCRDTQVIAGMRWTNLGELDGDLVRKGKLPPKLHGKHSLKAWGYRLGVQKGSFNEDEDDEETRWAVWTPEMQEYCETDTLVGTVLVWHIRKAGATPALAIETEQELRVYLDKQEKNGWPFDLDAAVKFQGRLVVRKQELEDELRAIFKCWLAPKKYKGLPVEFTPQRDDKKRGYLKGYTFSRLKLVEFNPGSRAHIADRLQTLYGWHPTVFTDGGDPKVDEDTLKSLPAEYPGVKAIIEYLLIGKRLGQLAEGDNAWLKVATKDRPEGGKLTGMYHIHHACLQSGTITHRCSHIKPNLGQVPAVDAPFGVECRSLFTVPKGWVEIGADASGLELRKLSHYMAKWDGGAYGKTVCEGKNEDGTDIHSVNRNALGLEGKPGRNSAKTFIYAFLYGSGELNLGQLLGCSPEEIAGFKKDEKRWKNAVGQLKKRNLPTDDYTVACLRKGALLKARFLKNLPALNNLIEAVKERAQQFKYLELQDGRRVPVRYQHSALNSLLQGAGAIDCKRWVVRFNRRLTAEFGEQGWNGKWAAVGFVHDEVQLAVRPEIADRVKTILVEEIAEVGREFNSRVPLTGEAKQGSNWASCH